MPKILPKQYDDLPEISPNVVLTGMAVTPQANPNARNMSVASGTYTIGGIEITSAGGTVTIDAGHATNPRIDAIVGNATIVTKATGTAGASPAFPTVATTEAILAYVYVPATHSSTSAKLVAWDPRAPHTNTGFFVDLGDTPDDYNGSTGYLVRVDQTAGGITFYNPASSGFADLIGYSNGASGLTAVTVQDAIDEILVSSTA